MKALIQRPLHSCSNVSFTQDLYEVDLSGELNEPFQSFRQLHSLRKIEENVWGLPECPILHKGYWDAHLHAMWMARDAQTISLEGVSGKEELVDFLNQKMGQDPDRNFFVAASWSEESLNCSLSELESYFSEHIDQQKKLLVWKKCHHAALVTRPLHSSQVLLRDEELFSIYSEHKSHEGEGVRQQFLQLQKKFLKKGIRGLGDMSLKPSDISLYQSLLEEKELLLNVRGVAQFEDCSPVLEAPVKSQLKQSFVVEHLKVFLDGSFGARTAWLTEAYLENGQYGRSLIRDEGLFNMARETIAKGFYLSFHCIGDAALDQVLRLGKSLGLKRESGHRHRLEHVQLCRHDQLEELYQQGWELFLQPIHAVEDAVFIEKRLPAAKISSDLHRLSSFLKRGSSVALSSDAPISSYDVEENIRRCTDFFSEKEALSFEQYVWFSSSGAEKLCQGEYPSFQVGDLVYLSTKY